MAQAQPSQQACCSPCTDSTGTEGPPGPQGPAGADGTNGTDGLNAFTATTVNFNQPAVGANVAVTMTSCDFLTVGQDCFIETGGYYLVVSKNLPSGGTIATLTNRGYTANAAPGAVIAAGAQVSPAGEKGAAGAAPAGALLAANNLSDVNSVAASRTSLGLGTAATKTAGVSNTNVAPVDDAAFTAGEAVFATAAGIESKSAANARTALGLGTAALKDSGIADTKIAPVDNIAGLTAGEALFATAAGMESQSAAIARASLGVSNALWGYGLLGQITTLDLNTAGDNTIAISPSRYIIDKVVLDNPSISITTATVGLYTAPASGGTTICADQSIAALTATTKYKVLTNQAVAGTDTFTSTAIYLKVAVPQGAAATCTVNVYGWRVA